MYVKLLEKGKGMKVGGRVRVGGGGGSGAFYYKVEDKIVMN